MPRQTITSLDAPKAIGPYAQGVSATGRLVFCSGQIPLDPTTGEIVGAGDVRTQTERVMQNLAAVLAAAGASLAHVTKTTIYLTDLQDFAAVNEVYAKHVGASPPARATVQVAGLPRGASVEIEAIEPIEDLVGAHAHDGVVLGERARGAQADAPGLERLLDVEGGAHREVGRAVPAVGREGVDRPRGCRTRRRRHRVDGVVGPPEARVIGRGGRDGVDGDPQALRDALADARRDLGLRLLDARPLRSGRADGAGGRLIAEAGLSEVRVADPHGLDLVGRRRGRRDGQEGQERGRGRH